ncbi:MAG: CpsD/CapB family tyrosine-protein kinase [Bacilli bacterium]|nr:CpsD/CapB family tyrosine-protein kinase [Bacilli bacterium]
MANNDIERDSTSFNEEIKKIRTNIKFSSVNDDVKVICVTSSLPGEGKSLISANLAASFAQYDEKVLLIDCDLRKGRQRKLFNIPNNNDLGLSKLLINKRWENEYRNYIKATKINNLSVIPTGIFPPNPSELLANERFANLINKLKEEYSMIILDCPPLEGLSDALVVSSLADTTVLVAKYKSTPVNLLEKSKKALDNVGSKLAGVVLNHVDKEPNTYYYGYYKEQ